MKKNRNETELRKQEMQLQREKMEMENEKMEQEAERTKQMFDLMAALIAQKGAAKMNE